MRRRAATETIEPYRRRLNAPEGNALRDRLAIWAAGVLGGITADDAPEMPAGVTDRAADVWESLLAVADLAGDEWPERARVSCVSLVSESMGDRHSLGVRLLADLREVFGGAPGGLDRRHRRRASEDGRGAMGRHERRADQCAPARGPAQALRSQALSDSRRRLDRQRLPRRRPARPMVALLVSVSHRTGNIGNIRNGRRSRRRFLCRSFAATGKAERRANTIPVNQPSAPAEHLCSQRGSGMTCADSCAPAPVSGGRTCWRTRSPPRCPLRQRLATR